jgi:uncharacterized protein
MKKVDRVGGMAKMPKRQIPGVGWHAYCLDTDGNTFRLIQSIR